MNKLKLFYLFLFALSLTIVLAQELPPIYSFPPEAYNAGDQNWAISQTSDKNIYVSNNKGLLEYNGARWQLYDSPNGTILRSVKVINNKIYTGSYMDFGYWQRNVFGGLEYTSLKEKANASVIEDEEFWEIIAIDDWVLFQSFERIFIYNIKNKNFKTIASNSRISKIFKVDRTLFFQKIDEGIFKIENGKELLYLDNEVQNALHNFV